MQMAQERHYWIKGRKDIPPFYERTDGWQIKREANGSWTLSRPGSNIYAVFTSTTPQPEVVHVAADNMILAYTRLKREVNRRGLDPKDD